MNQEQEPQILPITFHHIRDDEAPGLSATPAQLQKYILALKELKYVFLTARDAVARHNNKTLPLYNNYTYL